MTTKSIQLSQSIFELVKQRASKQAQTPDAFVERILVEQLQPTHPYITVEQSRSGPRPMISGTRIGVDVIVGYRKAGHTPEEIATDIVPELTLSQVYDALGYYEDNREVMDADFNQHSPAAWLARLRREMGEAAANKLLA